MNAQAQRDAQARRTRVICCIGCGLPLLGFQTTPFIDTYGDVYHSRHCYDFWEREMEALEELDR